MKVSIITVAFNSARTIEKTIQSVLSQSYPEIEYIVIDGGSTDGTLEIIQRYENRIAVWISEPDTGMYNAMNKGLAKASGDVIGILNSDDVYMSDQSVSELMGLMQKEQVDVVFADLILVDPIKTAQLVRYYDSSYFKPSRFRWGWMPAHPTVFVKKTLYALVGPFATDYQIAADYEMLIRILFTQKASYAYLPKPIVRMRVGGASTANWQRNWVLNQEIVKACKDNGIYTNLAMLLLKIPAKLWGARFTRKSRLAALNHHPD